MELQVPIHTRIHILTRIRIIQLHRQHTVLPHSVDIRRLHS